MCEVATIGAYHRDGLGGKFAEVRVTLINKPQVLNMLIEAGT